MKIFRKNGENYEKKPLPRKNQDKILAETQKSRTFAPAFRKPRTIRRREAAAIKGCERLKDVMSNNLFNHTSQCI